MLNKLDFTTALRAAFIAAALCTASAARANLVVNGDFETGDLTGWSTTGNVTYVQTPFFGFNDAKYGTTFAVFNPGNSAPNGVLSQTINTVAGSIYTLTFDYGVNGSGQSISVSATDSSNTLLSALLASSATTVPTTFNLNFVATTATTTIAFSDLFSNNTASQDGGIDNVSANVPEPASFTILGLATAAMLATRRRRAPTIPTPTATVMPL